MTIRLRDTSCNPTEQTILAAIAGDPRAKAVIESWRFRFPVKVALIPDIWFSLS